MDSCRPEIAVEMFGRGVKSICKEDYGSVWHPAINRLPNYFDYTGLISSMNFRLSGLPQSIELLASRIHFHQRIYHEAKGAFYKI